MNDSEMWLVTLRRGDSDRAWDEFIERYHRFISATVRTLLHDHDDVMDAFTYACEALRASDCARLRTFETAADRARFTTWLATVLRNLVVDWLRTRDGRQRVRAAVRRLPRRQRDAYEAIHLKGWTVAQAFEVVTSRWTEPPSFKEFLWLVAAAESSIAASDQGRLLPELVSQYRNRPTASEAVDVDRVPSPTADPDTEHVLSRLREELAATLSDLEPDVRLAILLYVVDDLPADQVARLVGWQGPKAVYNRVHRALAKIRLLLEEQGVSRSDLPGN